MRTRNALVVPLVLCIGFMAFGITNADGKCMRRSPDSTVQTSIVSRADKHPPPLECQVKHSERIKKDYKWTCICECGLAKGKETCKEIECATLTAMLCIEGPEGPIKNNRCDTVNSSIIEDRNCSVTILQFALKRGHGTVDYQCKTAFRGAEEADTFKEHYRRLYATASPGNNTLVPTDTATRQTITINGTVGTQTASVPKGQISDGVLVGIMLLITVLMA